VAKVLRTLVFEVNVFLTVNRGAWKMVLSECFLKTYKHMLVPVPYVIIYLSLFLF
jgi:hypothetical protein